MAMSANAIARGPIAAVLLILLGARGQRSAKLQTPTRIAWTDTTLAQIAGASRNMAVRRPQLPPPAR